MEIMKKQMEAGFWASRVPRGVAPYVNRVWLVGSQARGNASHTSDVDILLEPKSLSAEELVSCLQHLVDESDRALVLQSYRERTPRQRAPKATDLIVIECGQEQLFPERIELRV